MYNVCKCQTNTMIKFFRAYGLIILSASLTFTSVSLFARPEQCSKLKGTSYEGYGTKTLYEDALEYFRDNDNKKWPPSYDDDSFKKEHENLLRDNCEPVVFYFVGRHSARFPDADEITKYNNDLSAFVNELKNSKNLCASDLSQILQWQTRMQRKQDNLITEIGGEEEEKIAKRFKKILPKFFDAKESHVTIGVTSKIRTAQTAAEFLSEVQNLELPECHEDLRPTNNISDKSYSVERILNSGCYIKMMADHQKPFLEFHKKCQRLSGSSTKVKHPLAERVKSDKIKQVLADRVAARLGLPSKESGEPQITPELLDSIYSMCKYENAILNNSVWCRLLEREDIEALEYMEDASTYWNSAYGPNANVGQTCPLFGDLVASLRRGMESKDERPQSYFYFSHSIPMKKILARLELFEDNTSFTEDKIAEFEQDIKNVPKERHWRSSAITPFSANIAFTLYKCPKKRGSPKFKLLTTVTEHPVKIGSCKGKTKCNVENFFKEYDADCDLRKICGPTA